MTRSRLSAGAHDAARSLERETGGPISGSSSGTRRGKWLPHDRRRRLPDLVLLLHETVGRVQWDLCRPWSSDDGRRRHGSSTVTVSSCASAQRTVPPRDDGCGDDSGWGGRGSNTLSMPESPTTRGRANSQSRRQWVAVCGAAALWHESDETSDRADPSGSEENLQQHESMLFLAAGRDVDGNVPESCIDSATARQTARSSSTITS